MGYMDVLCEGFSKAFNKMDYDIFVAKLNDMGFRNLFYSWLVSFFVRHQTIC